MNESSLNQPGLNRIDTGPIEPQRTIPQALIFTGKLYETKPISIPAEYIPQLQELTQELFGRVNLGDTDDMRSRNKEIARRYFNFDNNTKTTLKELSNEFQITPARVRQITKRFGMRLKSTAARDEKLKEIIYFLPFKTWNIGHDIFGGNITPRELKDKLPEEITAESLNLSDLALMNFRKSFGRRESYPLMELLTSPPNLLRQDTRKELAKALEKFGLNAELDNS